MPMQLSDDKSENFQSVSQQIRSSQFFFFDWFWFEEEEEPSSSSSLLASLFLRDFVIFEGEGRANDNIRLGFNVGPERRKTITD